jgi:transglutaminase-like putative cysteine protease
MRKIFFVCLLCLMIASCNNSQGNFIDNATIVESTYTPQPTFTPYPTYTPYPTATPVPETWYHYRITYSILLDDFRGITKVWMPAPVDSVTQQSIKLTNVHPTPKDIFFEPKGNQIVYWQENIQDDGFEFSEQFDVYILKKVWDIKLEDVGSYNLNDPALAYLAPSTMIQSDNPEIVAVASEIIGEETNPYQKIKLIINYLDTNMISGGINEDAVSVIRTNQVLACGAAAHIFVALSRAAGVPARVVTGIAGLREGTFNWRENNFGTHMWVEFYLPNYGWIPADMSPLFFGNSDALLAKSDGNRIILSRASDIDLGYGRGNVPWFHMPHVNTHQEEGSAVMLTVELLGIEEKPEY